MRRKKAAAAENKKGILKCMLFLLLKYEKKYAQI